MSDLALGYLIIGVLVSLVVIGVLYDRLSARRPHRQVSDEAVRRAKALDEGRYGRDPRGDATGGLGF